MRIKRQLILVAITFSLIGIFSQTAEACMCVGGQAPCEDFWKADAVFSGTVISSSQISVMEAGYKSTRRQVRLTIEESFRGISGIEADVLTGFGETDCGFAFKQGQRYLVYANRYPTSGHLSTSTCSRTRLLTDATDDLAYFRSLPTAEPTGTIFGKVIKRNFERKENAPWFLPVSDAELTIEGQAQTHELHSDADGNFRVARLKPGKYKVRLKLPQGLTTEGSLENEIEVPRFGCAETGFYLQSDTRVRGRVVDSSGSPVASLSLSMRGAFAQNNANVFLNAITDADGRFEFKAVPPGDYFLGFRILMSQNEMSPYPRTYYPGVPLRTQATVISVREDAGVKDLEMRMPPALETYEVEGTVVWPDGRPVPKASIYLSLSEEGDFASLSSPPTDENGRFTLKLFEGLSYKISAFLSRPNQRGIQSPWTDVPTKNGPRSIKIVLVDDSR